MKNELRQRSTRRFGFGSLAGRMVLLLLVPLVFAQVLVFRDLDRRRAAASDAATLVAEMAVLRSIGSIYAPASFESITSQSLALVDAMGVDRSIVVEVLGVDYQPHVLRARTQLDAALNSLVVEHGDLLLADGQPLSGRLTALRAALAQQRDLLDGRVADPNQIAGAVNDILLVADEIVAHADHLLAATNDGAVTPVTATAAHVMVMLQAVAKESRAVNTALASDTGFDDPTTSLEAGGVAAFTIKEYGEFVADDAVATAEWNALQQSEPITAYEAIRPQIVDAFNKRLAAVDGGSTDSTVLLVSDPAFVRLLADLLQIAIARLDAYEQFGIARFADLTQHATEIGAEAERGVHEWTLVLVAVSVGSFLILILTLLTTRRPLKRLTDRAREVGAGEISPTPLPVTGPSDVRAVTVTFNSMTSTLSTFEDHLARLAAGDAAEPSEMNTVPGSLGRSLRASFDRLSTTTAQLRESEALARAIVDTASDAIWTVDERGVILTANAASERLTDVDLEQQIGHILGEVFGSQTEVSQLSGDFEFTRPDGSRAHTIISQGEVHVDEARIHTVFARDVSDRKRFEERLAYQARHDMLTDLPNRLAAIEHLEAALVRDRLNHLPVGVLFVDLDGFKAVNDSRGHAAGDELLREVSGRLRRGLRETEFVGRLGGDEFIVVTEGLDLSGLAALAERLIIEVAQPFQSGDDMFAVTATAGAALTTGSHPIDALELIRQADVAVYLAKGKGRGRVEVFDESLQQVVEANAETELALRSGIMRDELELHFQPIMDLRTDRPWGAEALVRWNRPGHGQLPPDRFIPIAERSTLIIDLERWVLRTALTTLAAWQADPERRHLRLAVNISGRHLMEGDLVDDIAEMLDRTGADPRGLEIELTETHLLADLERANVVLRALREWGIDVAVDDFGTGYSSMSYLRQLEIDTIKIDRMFVARTQHAGYDRTIVEVLLQLASSLGLDVVAEGVETSEQLAFLQDRDCGRVQGYHLARPMPLALVNDWLTSTDLSSSIG